jgi:hypothetical protein
MRRELVEAFLRSSPRDRHDSGVLHQPAEHFELCFDRSSRKISPIELPKGFTMRRHSQHASGHVIRLSL